MAGCIAGRESGRIGAATPVGVRCRREIDASPMLFRYEVETNITASAPIWPCLYSSSCLSVCLSVSTCGLLCNALKSWQTIDLHAGPSPLGHTVGIAGTFLLHVFMMLSCVIVGWISTKAGDNLWCARSRREQEAVTMFCLKFYSPRIA